MSGPALEADHERLTGRRETTREIARRAVDDKGADATLRRYETRLARALAAVINIVDPACAARHDCGPLDIAL